MDINNVLTYLKEELKDIPANPDNVHYTDFEGLYYILQSGLKGQKGGYTVKLPKTNEHDMELCTVRNTHKITPEEMRELSIGASGGVKINLFTDRILAAHRGTKKGPIAELPQQRKVYLQQDAKSFKAKYGYDVPDLTVDEPGHEFSPRKEIKVLDWMDANKHPEDNKAVADILSYNISISDYYKELRKREREERFILKKSIPVDPKFMEIVIEKKPEDMSFWNKEFCEGSELIRSYLSLLDKHQDVFLDNKNFRLFKNYLRSKING